MDRQTATKLITSTFENPFDKTRFINFSRNLVNHLDVTDNFTYQGNLIYDSFEDDVQSLERIGKYTDGDGKNIDLLIVKLKKSNALERARTRQRNYVARYLQTRGEKDAALVAFVSPSLSDWRFSLIKMEYELGTTPTGRIKTETELTPARRYSFLVGQDESSHTAQRQLLPILENDLDMPSLSEFEKAFSVEVVTREFFTKYRELFWDVEDALQKLTSRDECIKTEFASKNIDIANFAKKLLGQIVFLYFLQKKGWFGAGRDAEWGTGPKDFLRRLFDKNVAQYTNFFNDILEPLFYEALANERAEDFYSRFNCKIPFLNGGLFDPINDYSWVHVDILLPNELFSNSEKTKEGDTGTGILNVFDRYNFTVKEDEPLDKEVAVDPEMLGKVFENLLEVKDRKSKGTYYTPREIVHYMCQESLINYLDTAVNTGEVALVKENPVNLKLIGPPAVQQQALKTEGHTNRVPREDIESLVRMGDTAIEHDETAVRKQDEIDQGKIKTTLYGIKLRTIAENAKLLDDVLATIRVCDPAIGSGAFPVGMMTEIVRARNTLTTYMPDKTGRTNYHFKRHAIQHCLYGVDIDPGAVEIAKLRLWLSLVVDEDDIKQIQPLPNLDYKIVCGNSLLGVERNIFNNALFKELESLIPIHFNETNAKKKIGYKSQIDGLIGELTDNKKVFDFQVYFSSVFHEKGGFDIVIANPPYGAKFTNSEKAILKNTFTHSITGKFESYRIFIEKGTMILHKGAILTYVVPNTWMFLEQAARLRKYLLMDFKLMLIINFPQKAFDAMVDSITFSIVYARATSSHKVKVIDVPLAESINNVEKYEAQARYYDQNLWVNSNKYIISYIANMYENDFIDRIKSRSDTFGNHMFTKQGLIPYLTKEEGSQNKFIEKTQPNKSWKPYLDGSRYVGRYIIKPGNSYIKYGDWLYAPREQWIFQKERIIFQLIRNISLDRRIVATYLDTELYSDRNTGLIFVKEESNLDIRYLLAVFNSSLINYIHSKTHNSTYISFPSIECLPLRKISVKEQKPLIDLVSQILAITKDEGYLSNPTKQTKVKELESQIDRMVYQLYNLTHEEIAIVENSVKQTVVELE